MSERNEGDPTHANIREVCETFGVSPEIAKKSSQWAHEWKRVLTQNHAEGTNDRAALEYTRDLALQSCPDIPRDENGDPSFRTLFATNQLFYGSSPNHSETYRSALEGDGLRVIPHFDRLDSIVETLLEARMNNEFPYGLDAAMLPQDERNMPPELPRGGKEHANFLWATCYYMRGGIKSYAAFRALSGVYAKEPELFDPYHAMHDNPERVTKLLEDNSLSFSAQTIGPAWVENARRMVELYDGDPRQLFDNTSSYDTLLKRIQNDHRGNGFIGFQEKMVSMITYYLMEADILPYFDFPLPVDFHVLRVSAANEIITFENLPESGDIYSDQTLSMLRSLYHDFSVTHGVSQLDVCNAVWALSQAICGTQPGNIMLEPGDRNERQGRSTHIIPLPIDTNNPSQIAMYERSCALCPLEGSCVSNMPSKEYYVRGRAILSPRIRFESVNLELFADDALRRLTRKPTKN